VASLDPAPGVVPYAINVPFWSDNAIKTRWFSMPNTNLTLGFDPMGNWSFPTGSVWIKHFELELTNGLPGSRQRLETRLLVRNSAGIHGATYRWGASLTNATLVPEEGMDESFVIHDGGVIRTQVWHYPARAECQQCHSAQGGLALGFNTPQLHCDTDYGGMVTNQLRAFEEAGYFSAPLGTVQPLRALAHATNSAVSLEYRVRSYLAANCRQCHQGYGSALFDANISTTTAAAGLIDGALYDNLGNTNNRVIHPASLDLSVLYQRVANLGGNHMPPLATTLIDTQNVALVAAWITNDLPAYQAFADWRAAQAWALPEDGDALADPDHDGAVNRLEWLTETDPLLASDYWNMGIQRSGADVQILIPLIANRAFQVQYTDQPDAGSVWTPLDVPENRPIFPASSYPHMVTDPTSSEGMRLYRVLVYEP
jgi:mono/diheme cytochrome c family protein